MSIHQSASLCSSQHLVQLVSVLSAFLSPLSLIFLSKFCHFIRDRWSGKTHYIESHYKLCVSVSSEAAQTDARLSAVGQEERSRKHEGPSVPEENTEENRSVQRTQTVCEHYLIIHHRRQHNRLIRTSSRPVHNSATGSVRKRPPLDTFQDTKPVTRSVYSTNSGHYLVQNQANTANSPKKCDQLSVPENCINSEQYRRQIIINTKSTRLQAAVKKLRSERAFSLQAQTQVIQAQKQVSHAQKQVSRIPTLKNQIRVSPESTSLGVGDHNRVYLQEKHTSREECEWLPVDVSNERRRLNGKHVKLTSSCWIVPRDFKYGSDLSKASKVQKHISRIPISGNRKLIWVSPEISCLSLRNRKRVKLHKYGKPKKQYISQLIAFYRFVDSRRQLSPAANPTKSASRGWCVQRDFKLDTDLSKVSNVQKHFSRIPTLVNRKLIWVRPKKSHVTVRNPSHVVNLGQDNLTFKNECASLQSESCHCVDSDIVQLNSTKHASTSRSDHIDFREEESVGEPNGIVNLHDSKLSCNDTLSLCTSDSQEKDLVEAIQREKLQYLYHIIQRENFEHEYSSAPVPDSEATLPVCPTNPCDRKDISNQFTCEHLSTPCVQEPVCPTNPWDRKDISIQCICEHLSTESPTPCVQEHNQASDLPPTGSDVPKPQGSVKRAQNSKESSPPSKANQKLKRSVPSPNVYVPAPDTPICEPDHSCNSAVQSPLQFERFSSILTHFKELSGEPFEKLPSGKSSQRANKFKTASKSTTPSPTLFILSPGGSRVRASEHLKTPDLNKCKQGSVPLIVAPVQVVSTPDFCGKLPVLPKDSSKTSPPVKLTSNKEMPQVARQATATRSPNVQTTFKGSNASGTEGSTVKMFSNKLISIDERISALCASVEEWRHSRQKIHIDAEEPTYPIYLPKEKLISHIKDNMKGKEIEKLFLNMEEDLCIFDKLLRHSSAAISAVSPAGQSVPLKNRQEDGTTSSHGKGIEGLTKERPGSKILLNPPTTHDKGNDLVLKIPPRDEKNKTSKPQELVCSAGMGESNTGENMRQEKQTNGSDPNNISEDKLQDESISIQRKNAHPSMSSNSHGFEQRIEDPQLPKKEPVVDFALRKKLAEIRETQLNNLLALQKMRLAKNSGQTSTSQGLDVKESSLLGNQLTSDNGNSREGRRMSDTGHILSVGIKVAADCERPPVGKHNENVGSQCPLHKESDVRSDNDGNGRQNIPRIVQVSADTAQQCSQNVVDLKYPRGKESDVRQRSAISPKLAQERFFVTLDDQPALKTDKDKKNTWTNPKSKRSIPDKYNQFEMECSIPGEHNQFEMECPIPEKHNQFEKERRIPETHIQIEERPIPEKHNQFDKEHSIPEMHNQLEKGRSIPEMHNRFEMERRIPETHNQIEKERFIPEMHNQFEMEHCIPETHNEFEKERPIPEKHNQFEKEHSIPEIHNQFEECPVPEKRNQFEKERRIPEKPNQCYKGRSIPEMYNQFKKERSIPEKHNQFEKKRPIPEEHNQFEEHSIPEMHNQLEQKGRSLPEQYNQLELKERSTPEMHNQFEECPVPEKRNQFEKERRIPEKHNQIEKECPIPEKLNQFEKERSIPEKYNQLEQEERSLSEQFSHLGLKERSVSEKLNLFEKKEHAIPEKYNQLEPKERSIPEKYSHLEPKERAIPEKHSQFEECSVPEKQTSVEKMRSIFEKRIAPKESAIPVKYNQFEPKERAIPVKYNQSEPKERAIPVKYNQSEPKERAIPVKYNQSEPKERAIPVKYNQSEPKERSIPEKYNQFEPKERHIPEKYHQFEKERGIPEKYHQFEPKERAIPEKYHQFEKKERIIPEKYHKLEQKERSIPDKYNQFEQKDGRTRSLDTGVHVRRRSSISSQMGLGTDRDVKTNASLDIEPAFNTDGGIRQDSDSRLGSYLKEKTFSPPESERFEQNDGSEPCSKCSIDTDVSQVISTQLASNKKRVPESNVDRDFQLPTDEDIRQDSWTYLRAESCTPHMCDHCEQDADGVTGSQYSLTDEDQDIYICSQRSLDNADVRQDSSTCSQRTLDNADVRQDSSRCSQRSLDNADVRQDSSMCSQRTLDNADVRQDSSMCSQRSLDNADVRQDSSMCSERSLDNADVRQDSSMCSQRSLDNADVRQDSSVCSQRSLDNADVRQDSSVCSQHSLDNVDVRRDSSVCSQRSLDTANVRRDRSVGSQRSLDTANVRRDRSIGSQRSLGTANVRRDRSIGSQRSLDNVDVRQDSSVCSQRSIDNADVRRDRSVGSQRSVDIADVRRDRSVGSQRSIDNADVRRDSSVCSQRSMGIADVRRDRSIGSQRSLDNVDVRRDRSIGSHRSLDNVDVRRDRSIGSHRSLDNVDVRRDRSIASQRSLENVDVRLDRSIASQRSLDNVDVRRDRSIASQRSLDNVDVRRDRSIASQRSLDIAFERPGSSVCLDIEPVLNTDDQFENDYENVTGSKSSQDTDVQHGTSNQLIADTHSDDESNASFDIRPCLNPEEDTRQSSLADLRAKSCSPAIFEHGGSKSSLDTDIEGQESSSQLAADKDSIVGSSVCPDLPASDEFLLDIDADVRQNSSNSIQPSDVGRDAETSASLDIEPSLNTASDIRQGSSDLIKTDLSPKSSASKGLEKFGQKNTNIGPKCSLDTDADVRQGSSIQQLAGKQRDLETRVILDTEPALNTDGDSRQDSWTKLRNDRRTREEYRNDVECQTGSVFMNFQPVDAVPQQHGWTDVECQTDSFFMDFQAVDAIPQRHEWNDGECQTDSLFMFFQPVDAVPQHGSIDGVCQTESPMTVENTKQGNVLESPRVTLNTDEDVRQGSCASLEGEIASGESEKRIISMSLQPTSDTDGDARAKSPVSGGSMSGDAITCKSPAPEDSQTSANWTQDSSESTVDTSTGYSDSDDSSKTTPPSRESNKSRRTQKFIQSHVSTSRKVSPNKVKSNCSSCNTFSTANCSVSQGSLALSSGKNSPLHFQAETGARPKNRPRKCHQTESKTGHRSDGYRSKSVSSPRKTPSPNVGQRVPPSSLFRAGRSRVSPTLSSQNDDESSGVPAGSQSDLNLAGTQELSKWLSTAFKSWLPDFNNSQKHKSGTALEDKYRQEDLMQTQFTDYDVRNVIGAYQSTTWDTVGEIASEWMYNRSCPHSCVSSLCNFRRTLESWKKQLLAMHAALDASSAALKSCSLCNDSEPHAKGYHDCHTMHMAQEFWRTVLRFKRSHLENADCPLIKKSSRFRSSAGGRYGAYNNVCEENYVQRCSLGHEHCCSGDFSGCTQQEFNVSDLESENAAPCVHVLLEDVDTLLNKLEKIKQSSTGGDKSKPVARNVSNKPQTTTNKKAKHKRDDSSTSSMNKKPSGIPKPTFPNRTFCGEKKKTQDRPPTTKETQKHPTIKETQKTCKSALCTWKPGSTSDYSAKSDTSSLSSSSLSLELTTVTTDLDSESVDHDGSPSFLIAKHVHAQRRHDSKHKRPTVEDRQRGSGNIKEQYSSKEKGRQVKCLEIGSSSEETSTRKTIEVSVQVELIQPHNISETDSELLQCRQKAKTTPQETLNVSSDHDAKPRVDNRPTQTPDVKVSKGSVHDQESTTDDKRPVSTPQEDLIVSEGLANDKENGTDERIKPTPPETLKISKCLADDAKNTTDNQIPISTPQKQLNKCKGDNENSTDQRLHSTPKETEHVIHDTENSTETRTKSTPQDTLNVGTGLAHDTENSADKKPKSTDHRPKSTPQGTSKISQDCAHDTENSIDTKPQCVTRESLNSIKDVTSATENRTVEMPKSTPKESVSVSKDIARDTETSTRKASNSTSKETVKISQNSAHDTGNSTDKKPKSMPQESKSVSKDMARDTENSTDKKPKSTQQESKSVSKNVARDTENSTDKKPKSTQQETLDVSKRHASKNRSIKRPETLKITEDLANDTENSTDKRPKSTPQETLNVSKCLVHNAESNTDTGTKPTSQEHVSKDKRPRRLPRKVMDSTPPKTELEKKRLRTLNDPETEQELIRRLEKIVMSNSRCMTEETHFIEDSNSHHRSESTEHKDVHRPKDPQKVEYERPQPAVRQQRDKQPKKHHSKEYDAQPQSEILEQNDGGVRDSLKEDTRHPHPAARHTKAEQSTKDSGGERKPRAVERDIPKVDCQRPHPTARKRKSSKDSTECVTSKQPSFQDFTAETRQPVENVRTQDSVPDSEYCHKSASRELYAKYVLSKDDGNTRTGRKLERNKVLGGAEEDNELQDNTGIVSRARAGSEEQHLTEKDTSAPEDFFQIFNNLEREFSMESDLIGHVQLLKHRSDSVLSRKKSHQCSSKMKYTLKRQGIALLVSKRTNPARPHSVTQDKDQQTDDTVCTSGRGCEHSVKESKRGSDGCLLPSAAIDQKDREDKCSSDQQPTPKVKKYKHSSSRDRKCKPPVRADLRSSETGGEGRPLIQEEKHSPTREHKGKSHEIRMDRSTSTGREEKDVNRSPSTEREPKHVSRSSTRREQNRSSSTGREENYVNRSSSTEREKKYASRSSSTGREEKHVNRIDQPSVRDCKHALAIDQVDNHLSNTDRERRSATDQGGQPLRRVDRRLANIDQDKPPPIREDKLYSAEEQEGPYHPSTSTDRDKHSSAREQGAKHSPVKPSPDRLDLRSSVTSCSVREKVSSTGEQEGKHLIRADCYSSTLSSVSNQENIPSQIQEDTSSVKYQQYKHSRIGKDKHSSAREQESKPISVHLDSQSSVTESRDKPYPCVFQTEPEQTSGREQEHRSFPVPVLRLPSVTGREDRPNYSAREQEDKPFPLHDDRCSSVSDQEDICLPFQREKRSSSRAREDYPIKEQEHVSIREQNQSTLNKQKHKYSSEQNMHPHREQHSPVKKQDEKPPLVPKRRVKHSFDEQEDKLYLTKETENKCYVDQEHDNTHCSVLERENKLYSNKEEESRHSLTKNREYQDSVQNLTTEESQMETCQDNSTEERVGHNGKSLELETARKQAGKELFNVIEDLLRKSQANPNAEGTAEESAFKSAEELVHRIRRIRLMTRELGLDHDDGRPDDDKHNRPSLVKHASENSENVTAGDPPFSNTRENVETNIEKELYTRNWITKHSLSAQKQSNENTTEASHHLPSRSLEEDAQVSAKNNLPNSKVQKVGQLSEIHRLDSVRECSSNEEQTVTRTKVLGKHAMKYLEHIEKKLNEFQEAKSTPEASVPVVATCGGDSPDPAVVSHVKDVALDGQFQPVSRIPERQGIKPRLSRTDNTDRMLPSQDTERKRQVTGPSSVQGTDPGVGRLQHKLASREPSFLGTFRDIVSALGALKGSSSPPLTESSQEAPTAEKRSPKTVKFALASPRKRTLSSGCSARVRSPPLEAVAGSKESPDSSAEAIEVKELSVTQAFDQLDSVVDDLLELINT